MPLLPSFDELWAAGDEAELLLGIVLLMSCRGKQEHGMQSRLLPTVRQHCIACILHSPRNVYDIVALIIAALHLPLLLGTLSDGKSFDGSGLLSSAASAARSLGLDSASVDLSATQLSPTSARHSCLWTLLCLCTSFASLAGDIDRKPLVKCSWTELDALQSYSDSLGGQAGESIVIQRQCASISLLVFRTRATIKMRESCHMHAGLLHNFKAQGEVAQSQRDLQVLTKAAIDALQSTFDGVRKDMTCQAKKLGVSRGLKADRLGC